MINIWLKVTQLYNWMLKCIKLILALFCLVQSLVLFFFFWTQWTIPVLLSAVWPPQSVSSNMNPCHMHLLCACKRPENLYAISKWWFTVFFFPNCNSLILRMKFIPGPLSIFTLSLCPSPSPALTHGNRCTSLSLPVLSSTYLVLPCLQLHSKTSSGGPVLQSSSP